MITGTFHSLAGEIKVEIDADSSPHTVEIVNFGNLKYEFDLTPETVSIDRLQALYSRLKLTIYQLSDSGVDLYDLIVSEASGGAIPVDVEVDSYKFKFKLNFNGISFSETERLIELELEPNADESITSNEASTFTENFKIDGEEFPCVGVLTWIGDALRAIYDNGFDNILEPTVIGTSVFHSDFSYLTTTDLKEEGILGRYPIGFWMLKLEDTDFDKFLEPYTPQGRAVVRVAEESNEITGIGTRFTDLKRGDKLTITFETEEFWRDTLVGVVDTVISDEELTLISSYHFDDPPEEYPEPAFCLSRDWQVEPRVPVSNGSALKALIDIAGFEGALFGCGFSKNFYVNRLRTADIVNVPWDDIITAERQSFFNRLADSFVENIIDHNNEGFEQFGQIANNVPNLIRAGTLYVTRQATTSTLEVSVAPGYPYMCKGVYDGSDVKGDYEFRSDPSTTWSNDKALEKAVSERGITAYMESLSSQEAKLVAEFEVFGFDSIKPWQIIRLTGAPPVYQNKLFRPTSLDYNAVNDTVKVKAYEVEVMIEPSFPLKSVESTTNSIKVEWPDRYDDYNVIINGSVLETVTDAEYTFGGLDPATVYDIAVVAYKSSEIIAYSLPFRATTSWGELTAEQVGSTESVQVNWSDVGADSYKLDRIKNDILEPEINPPHTSIGYLDEDLFTGDRVQYQLRVQKGAFTKFFPLTPEITIVA